MANFLEKVQEERTRQIKGKGLTPEYDLITNKYEQLATAAACYASPEENRGNFSFGFLSCWPFDIRWWKPSPLDRKKEIIKAAALLYAEYDRLDKLEKKGGDR